ncbi:hypothetical protein Sjap_004174 [Stephania japonica]|uniref:Uncharacterized protein n=1 Tax=Stephania japonica TaxID=461633 RepID=A0AAP0K1U7_9MAGN
MSYNAISGPLPSLKSSSSSITYVEPPLLAPRHCGEETIHGHEGSSSSFSSKVQSFAMDSRVSDMVVLLEKALAIAEEKNVAIEVKSELTVKIKVKESGN